MRKNQKGFSLVEGLLIFIAMTVVGFGGYLVWNRQNDATKSSSESSNDTNDEEEATASDFTYTLEKTAVSFSYPADWTVVSKTDIDEQTFEDITLTAPDTSEIKITVFKFLGGFTGEEGNEEVKDVIEAKNGTSTYAMVTTAESGGFTTASIMNATPGKYTKGGDISAVPHWFSVSLENGDRVQMSITISGPGDEDFGESKNYATLAEFQALDSYKAAKKFMESLTVQ